MRYLLYDYPEISECTGYLCKTFLCFVSPSEYLFILIIDPLAHGSLFSGIHHWGEGLLLVFADWVVLFKEDCQPASLFLTWGPKVPLKQSWRALPTLSHLWWRRKLKMCLEFCLFYKYIDGLSSPLSLAIWTWFWMLLNMKKMEHSYGRCDGGEGKTFLTGIMLIFGNTDTQLSKDHIAS